ncbi:MAG TPA: class I SAM-dependent methyltransferase [Longimicrobiaceae bacterium]
MRAVSSTVLYEDQATHFDERAGIPVHVEEAVAREVVSLTGLGNGGLLLDVGAGTGSLSLSLVRWVDRYVGFDRSPAMVAVFRGLVGDPGPGVELLVADGNERWPVEDRSTSVVFSARAIHHLDPAHVAAEARRVLRPPGGWLVLGRVRRPPDSPKSEMRRQMRRLLAAEGYPGRSGDAAAEAVFGVLERLGGERAEPRVAGRWTVRHRPADSIAAWEGKSGLAGVEIPAEVKDRVLSDLRAWAAERFGSLDAPLPQEEAFEIAAIRIPIA